MNNNEYDLARRRLHKALDDIAAKGIEGHTAFVALIDLVVDWSMQLGGKRVLWDALGLMHIHLAELHELEQTPKPPVVH